MHLISLIVRMTSWPARAFSLLAGLAAAIVVIGVQGMPVQAAEELRSKQSGQVRSGTSPVRASTVRLYQAGTVMGAKATLLGQAKTDDGGFFRIDYTKPSNKQALLYLVANGGSTVLGLNRTHGPIGLATMLGTRRGLNKVVINERTTVAVAYAFAQFINGRNIAGAYPGPKNAAATLRNLVDLGTGAVGDVLATRPNGYQTQTMREFNSLANLLATCVRGTGAQSCERLFALATPPRGTAPKNTLQAAVNIAHFPGNKAAQLFALSARSHVYHPVLGEAPATWTIALRYVGNGHELDGPGNMTIDPDGNVWIGNNYAYRRSPHKSTCGGTKLLRLDPSGKDVRGAPYTGGGIYGVGYGIIMDPKGNIWVSNFGFQGTGCTDTQYDTSLSKFTSRGVAKSPDVVGYTQGDIKRPQGMASDRDGNIWTASCGNDSVVLYPKGKPALARNFASTGAKRPFDVAADIDGNVWVTGNLNNRMVKLDKDGKVLFRSKRGAGGIKKPMGVAVDSLSNAWVANSGVVAAPCYKANGYFNPPQPADSSLVMVSPDGAAIKSFTGGGIVMPWGVSMDGNDNIWVTNFTGQRLSYFCGARPENCPPGHKTGDAISPSSGYAFDGLTRNTAVQIDASGNVWVTNNWLTVPYQTNPGGKEMVVFVGLGAPTKTPVIGPPEKP